MEDLRDLAEHGLSDLFEYGQEFMIGNALGDGKPKDNTTEPENETFQQKYRKTLKKDLSEIENEVEPEDMDTVTEADLMPPEDEVFEDNEEFVSSDDMFKDEGL